MKKTAKGFTLIELLVVIAIIGLLSTLAVVALNSARQKARDAKRVSDIKQISTALELFYSDNSGYPMVAATVNLGAGSDVCLYNNTTDAFAAAGCANAYMPVIPAPPATPSGQNYAYIGRDATDAANCVTGTTCPNYRITFTTEAVPTGLPTCTGNNYIAKPSGISC